MGNLNSTTRHANRWIYMSHFGANNDLCTLTTRCASQVPVGTWKGSSNLNSCLAQEHLYFEDTRHNRLQLEILHSLIN